jgi:outer membrane receptor protein involved in Fe transport
MLSMNHRCACVGLALAGSVFAQTASPRAVPDSENLDEIIVTGSRLQITSAESAAPVTVLDRRDLERGGADSLGEVLQSLPMVAGSPVNSNDDGGLGATRIDLRGLGSERTLVLLNGRRLPNGGIGGDASVDVNSLPMSLIDRVEVLASGASAVHGSDAVGGVVNVITRRPSRAASVAGAWRITNHGDGQVAKGDAAIGFDILGGTWSLGIDFVRQDGVTGDQRDYSAQPLRILDSEGTVGYAGQTGIPDGVFGVPAGNVLGLDAGRYTRVAGATGQTAADYRPFAREDSFSVAPYNYSRSPNERGSLWLLGSQPLGETTQFFFEGLFHHRESRQSTAPVQFVSLVSSAPTLADGTNGIPTDNYYNPFGVDLPFAARRFLEADPRVVAENIDLWRVVAGLEGDRGAWHWELALGAARSQATTRSEGLFADPRYVDALGSSGPDDSGRIVCGRRDPLTGIVPAADVIPGCVPLDLFGGAGSVTQEQIDYMSPRALLDSGTNEQDLAEAVLRGPWGRVLGRPVQWAFGAEYRREAGSLIADPLRDLGFGGLVDPRLPGGNFNARELFAEVQVPLLHDRAGARDASLDAGVRRSDFSTFGFNTSWDAGLRWQLTNELTLRANYATVFRAPSLLELFEPPVPDAAFGFDPCGNDPTPAQQVHCAENGVPGGAYLQDESEFAVIGGGNTALGPETGDTFGVGAIYAPSWVRGLTASVDFFKINLSGVVGGEDIEVLLFDCAERGAAESCKAIHRLPDGRVALIAAFNQNLARREVGGIDLGVEWNGPTRRGDLSAGLLATYLERWDEQPFYSGGDVFHQAGRTDAGALPRWRGSGHVDWERGKWLASYSAEYIGSMTENVEDFPPLGVFFDPYQRRIASIVYHDLEAGYHFPEGFALRAGITNITDEDPPFINTGLPENTDPGTYRLLGRAYHLNLSYKF